MTDRSKCFRLLVAATFIAGAPSTFAAPPNPTKSDDFRNTAGGTDALSEIVGGEATSDNTAFGYRALEAGGTALSSIVKGTAPAYPIGPPQAQGSYNTAVGSLALMMGGGQLDTAVGASAASVDLANFETAIGGFALSAHQQGDGNTAVGQGALMSDLDGSLDVAVGAGAMGYLVHSGNNTAIGALAEGSATGGDNTVAIGAFALRLNAGNSNVAVGSSSMAANTSGENNVAVGYFALTANLSGNGNVALGQEALDRNVSGSANVAVGENALRNADGNETTVAGYSACWACGIGSNNSGVGFKVLYNNRDGSNNIALGHAAGYNLTQSNNIAIGSQGMAADSGVIRIGSPSTHHTTYVAGIADSKVTGAPVYITADGKLGTLASSAVYKTQVESLPSQDEKLRRLRPVSFHLKSDPDGATEYGLIAEEVAKIYPEIVTRDANGVIQGVRYDELAPLLLAQVQTQARDLETLKQQLTTVLEQNAQIKAELQRESQASVARQ